LRDDALHPLCLNRKQIINKWLILASQRDDALTVCPALAGFSWRRVVHLPHMTAAKETTLREVGEMLTHVAKHMVTKENLEAVRSELKGDIADLRTEMIDQFEHVEKQFRATHDRLREISSEIAVIHHRVERLEELGASNAGFAKEIDHLLARVTEIEKHLGIDKKIAA
jgi:hypothetical protein